MNCEVNFDVISHIQVRTSVPNIVNLIFKEADLWPDAVSKIAVEVTLKEMLLLSD